MGLRRLLYVRVSAQELFLTEFRTGRSWRGAPFVAFETATKRILKVGGEAKDLASPTVTVVNGFGQLDRGRIADPDLAAIAVRLAAKDVLKDPLFALRPDMVIQPLIDSGRVSTELERELCALGKLISVRRCAVWYGSELDRAAAEELISR